MEAAVSRGWIDYPGWSLSRMRQAQLVYDAAPVFRIAVSKDKDKSEQDEKDVDSSDGSLHYVEFWVAADPVTTVEDPSVRTVPLPPPTPSATVELNKIKKSKSHSSESANETLEKIGVSLVVESVDAASYGSSLDELARNPFDRTVPFGAVYQSSKTAGSLSSAGSKAAELAYRSRLGSFYRYRRQRTREKTKEMEELPPTRPKDLPDFA
eukprot:6481306-Amphidinium_carterae.1